MHYNYIANRIQTGRTRPASVILLSETDCVNNPHRGTPHFVRRRLSLRTVACAASHRGVLLDLLVVQVLDAL